MCSFLNPQKYPTELHKGPDYTYATLGGISINCQLIPVSVTMRRQRRRQSSCLTFSGGSLAACAADELGQQFYHRSPDGSSNATAVLRPKSITSVSP